MPMGPAQRAFNRRRKAAAKALLSWWKSRPCMDCGACFPPCAMDFDHRPGTAKRFAVNNSKVLYGLDTLVAEIAKCDIVCACCHRIRTEARRHRG